MRKLLLLLCVLLCGLSVVAKERIKVACVGNSVTYGYKLPNPAAQSYPTRLQELLGDKQYEVRNFGYSGSTLLRHGHRPYMDLPTFKEALKFRPDWVVIHLGLNDTDPRNWPNYQDEFLDDYTALIDSFKQVNPKAKIWICLMTPIFHDHRRFDSGTLIWHDQIQQRIYQLSQTNPNVAGLIDLYTPFHAHPEMFPDALHPDVDGALLLAQTVRKSILGDFGPLTLPDYYGEGMVMQQHKPLIISGMANAGEVVKVKFLDKTLTATTSADGHWAVEYAAQPAGGPYALEVKAKSGEVTIKEVWIGEVWLCSGQSNMEYRLNQAADAAADMAAADTLQQLHYFAMPAIRPTNDEVWTDSVQKVVNALGYLGKGAWQTCNRSTASGLSAIAYYFGKKLVDSLRCPVGIVLNAVGGSPTESWIDRSTIEHQFPALLRDWENNDFIQPWVRQRAMKNCNQQQAAAQRHPYHPAYLFESGIQPLAGMQLAGVVWYQGESNAHNVEMHERLFPLLENSWRQFFQQPQLPFLFVQLSALSRPSWPLFRDSQRRMAEALPRTWMTVSMDKGDSLDVHPRMKRPIGERLAAAALRHCYGFDAVLPSGPAVRSAVSQADSVIISFRYASGLHTADGKALRGFELAGADGLYHAVKAQVVGRKVVIVDAAVPHPVSVRYGWKPFNRDNLVNAVGYPCSTFEVNVTDGLQP